MNKNRSAMQRQLYRQASEIFNSQRVGQRRLYWPQRVGQSGAVVVESKSYLNLYLKSCKWKPARQSLQLKQYQPPLPQANHRHQLRPSLLCKVNSHCRLCTSWQQHPSSQLISWNSQVKRRQISRERWPKSCHKNLTGVSKVLFSSINLNKKSRNGSKLKVSRRSRRA